MLWVRVGDWAHNAKHWPNHASQRASAAQPLQGDTRNPTEGRCLDLFAGYTRDAVPVRGVVRGWPLTESKDFNYSKPHLKGLSLAKPSALGLPRGV
jgi:hypothetical protein